MRTLDQLAQQGLIERCPCDHDRRAKRIFLTADASPLLQQIDSVVEKAREEMLDGLNDEDIERLDDLLSRIEDNGLKIQARDDVKA